MFGSVRVQTESAMHARAYWFQGTAPSVTWIIGSAPAKLGFKSDPLCMSQVVGTSQQCIRWLRTRHSAEVRQRRRRAHQRKRCGHLQDVPPRRPSLCSGGNFKETREHVSGWHRTTVHIFRVSDTSCTTSAPLVSNCKESLTP